MAKIKILHVHTLPIISGSGIHTLITMCRLKDKGYDVEFACAPKGELIDEVVNNGIPFHPIKNFVHEISFFQDVMAFIELVRLMRRERYCIVHSHNSKAGFLTRIAARISGVPIIVHTIHGFAFHEYERPPRRLLFILLEKFAALLADKLIVVSVPLKKWGLALKIGRPQQYCVIPDGIEMKMLNMPFDPSTKRREFAFKEEDLIVGVVAKLWEGKGHRTLLEAAPKIIQEVPHVKFLFVGDGYLRPELEKMILSKGLKDNIILTGFRRDIFEITSIFDIAVLASFFEGLGRVLLEAMILEKAVVATHVGGIPEIVKEGVNGFLVPPGNPDLLAEAILKLLKDENLRKTMGQAGRKMIDEKFTAKKMVDDIESVYNHLLEKKGLK